jgi:hypothetical protein
MPVLIDTVYQRVLSIANKEQRGYITPLEFNLMANQAQLKIFEQYFYDLDQAKRKPSDITTFSDMNELIKNKLVPFTSIQTVVGGNTYPTNYRTGKIYATLATGDREVRLSTLNDVRNILDSPFHRTALSIDPIYIESTTTGQDITVFDGVAANGIFTGVVTCEIVSEPAKVEWGYTVVMEKALYNAGTSINFMLHDSEETELVMKILETAGVIIQDPGVIQYADNEEMKQVQQQKI